MNFNKKSSPGFFTPFELGLLLIIAVLTVICQSYLTRYLFPGGDISVFVYNTLNLPGPGSGVFLFGSIQIFWMILAVLIIKKPWTAIALSIITIALNLLIAEELNLSTLDVIFFIAIIIEALPYIKTGLKPLKYILPTILIILSIMTLAVLVTGNAKMGESGEPVMQFPFGYTIFCLLGLLLSVICFFYPLKVVFAGGIANIYYAIHIWLFWGGDGIATRFPVSYDTIPVILLIALTSGIISSMLAICLVNIYIKILSKRKLITNNIM